MSLPWFYFIDAEQLNVGGSLLCGLYLGSHGLEVSLKLALGSQRRVPVDIKLPIYPRVIRFIIQPVLVLVVTYHILVVLEPEAADLTKPDQSAVIVHIPLVRPLVFTFLGEEDSRHVRVYAVVVHHGDF